MEIMEMMEILKQMPRDDFLKFIGDDANYFELTSNIDEANARTLAEILADILNGPNPPTSPVFYIRYNVLASKARLPQIPIPRVKVTLEVDTTGGQVSYDDVSDEGLLQTAKSETFTIDPRNVASLRRRLGKTLKTLESFLQPGLSSPQVLESFIIVGIFDSELVNKLDKIYPRAKALPKLNDSDINKTIRNVMKFVTEEHNIDVLGAHDSISLANSISGCIQEINRQGGNRINLLLLIPIYNLLALKSGTPFIEIPEGTPDKLKERFNKNWLRKKETLEAQAIREDI
ncbi:MAG: hypothetical protein LBJ93_00255 [Clostridiales bacterium]|jgi:hypothetical protein|nr:hypothetical protein [Clostridiales bacterium]